MDTDTSTSSIQACPTRLELHYPLNFSPLTCIRAHNQRPIKLAMGRLGEGGGTVEGGDIK